MGYSYTYSTTPRISHFNFIIFQFIVFKFKFIVPAKPENEASLRAIFGTKAAFHVRESSKGNYRAVTVDEKVSGPDDIFARYEAASKIPGIFSL